MKPFAEMTKDELLCQKEELEARYRAYQERKLALDMSRGKPGADQLDLSMGMLDTLTGESLLISEDGTDCRNYGGLDGIKEAKTLMADMMGTSADQVILYGNSSLNLMYDTISRSMTHGVMGSIPWCKLDQVKFLCPVPGYDRHFAITEFFGIEMIPIPMTESGPDMDLVEKLVSEDKSIKGIWCVPKYSNPQGITYSEETVVRFASLRPAAPDFRIYWDNAYALHHLYDHDQDTLADILKECEKAGNPNMVYEFGSTSKVSFPGSGIAVFASSEANISSMREQMKIQTIGHDKINQLRHARFFGGIEGLKKHMKKHADIIRPKFDAVIEILDRELADTGMGSWKKPKGGYFISFDAWEGCAKNIITMCKQAGLVMTQEGSTYPYGTDPKDSNIRIAPSFPPLSDLRTAMELFTLCVKMVSIDTLLEKL